MDQNLVLSAARAVPMAFALAVVAFWTFFPMLGAVTMDRKASAVAAGVVAALVGVVFATGVVEPLFAGDMAGDFQMLAPR